MPRKGTRFGITYYSPVALNFSDTPELNGLGPVLDRILTGLDLIGKDVGIDITTPNG